MTINEALGWVIVGGLIGGLCDYFNRFKLDMEKSKVCFHGEAVGAAQAFSLGAMNAFLGVGGAFAVQFAMISIGKFASEAGPESQMLLLSISVVAGFGGRRFLSLLSSKLEDQIGEANRKSTEALEEAEESIALSTALATLRPEATTGERVDAVSKLEKVLKRNPKDRTLTIIAGRLHRKNRDYTSAIAVLDRFLKHKDGNHDKDYADVLYNRACYQVLQAKQQGKPEDDQLCIRAMEDLKRSIEISRDNAEDAVKDEDYEYARNFESFKAITK